MSDASDLRGNTDGQAHIDRRNSEFWNELCGTSLARSLGVTDFSAASLEKFDRYYLRLYPYLSRYLRCEELRGKRVLEIGLGYGTVSQMIAASGAHYAGLDIAAGPVDLVNLRLAMRGLAGKAQPGNVLEAPFADGSFDAVITIGCLHHTGNLQRALDEVHRVLRPGGRALVMVYNAFSYRRWFRWPRATLRRFRNEGRAGPASAEERAAYDAGAMGAAPETVFTSRTELRRMCARYANCAIRKENAAREGPFFFVPRRLLLAMIGPVMGLDLYAVLEK